MPVDLRRATVAIEDERFYKHKGVDINAIVRAGIKNLESGETVQGGSTITQQLVRALYIKDPERNFARKIREAKLASELEEEHSQDLDPPQLPQLGALRHRRGTHRDRRRGGGGHVLRQARQQAQAGRVRAAGRAAPGALAVQPVPQPARRPSSAATRCSRRCSRTATSRGSSTRRRRAKDLGLKQGLRYVQRREPYFFDYVQEKLIERYGVGVVRAGGLRIHTTIDPEMQDSARDAINAYYGDPAGPSSAIVVDRSGQREDPGDGVERDLRRAPLQPRRPGPPPARLGVQDDGAHRRDPQGGRPRLDLLHLEAAQHQRPRVRRRGRSRPSATATAAR